MNRREFVSGGLTLLAASQISFNEVPMWDKPTIGLSHYEGLNNLDFDVAEYVKQRGDEGYTFIRFFIDLGWSTPPKFAIPPQSGVWPYKLKNKKFIPEVDERFIARINDAGRAAKQSGMEGIILCLATDPRYWDGTAKEYDYVSYPRQIGYESAEDLFHRGDFNEAQWDRYCSYLTDLGQICHDANNPFMYVMFETANELRRWGSILDECQGIKRAIKTTKPNAKFQINPPLDELHANDDFTWAKRLMDGVGGFKADRVSFHGFFTGKEVEDESAYLKRGGLPLNRIAFETDGATPNSIYTMQSHSGHFAWRPTWDDNDRNANLVIKAHRELIAAAKDRGVSLNIQDPIKWSRLHPNPARMKRFYAELAKEVQL